jgi:hypothetical protein
MEERIITTRAGTLTLGETSVTLDAGTAGPVELPLETLREVSLTNGGPFRSQLLLTDAGGQRVTFSLQGLPQEDRAALRRDLQRLAKVGAFEEGKYRTEIIPVTSFYNILTLVIVTPIVLSFLLGGAWLCTLGLGPLLLGAPLVAAGGFGAFALRRLLFGGIEGLCPICRGKVSSNIYSKRVVCLHCLNILHIRQDFFEVDVRPAPPAPEVPDDEEDEDDDYYDYRR